MLFEKLRVFSCRRGDEHQEEGRELLQGRQPATHHEVRRLSGGFGERLWIFRWDSALITCVHTHMNRETRIVAVLFLLVVSRCKLRAHEHNGHHRFRGFTPSSCAAGSKGLCFRAAALPARCGGGLLLQPVSDDHHEQRPPQTGTTLPRGQTLTLPSLRSTPRSRKTLGDDKGPEGKLCYCFYVLVISFFLHTPLTADRNV